MNRPDGTAEREAVRRFVATPPGRQQLLTLVMNALSESWNQPRGPMGTRSTSRLSGISRSRTSSTRRTNSRVSSRPQLEDLGHALLGVRYRASKSEWSVWADIRAPGGQHRGTMAIFRPPFASGEALVDAMKTLCENAEPGEDVSLPEYPRLRFRILPFEEGLSRYDAIMSPLGHSIEKTAFWFETLRSWPELMKSEALLPWVIRVEGVEP